MNSNWQFYGVVVLVGLVFSLPFWKASNIPVWRILVIVLSPVVLVLLKFFVIVVLAGERIVDSFELLMVFDAKTYWKPELASYYTIRGFGVAVLLFSAYFMFVWDLIWRLKNKAYQDGRDN